MTETIHVTVGETPIYVDVMGDGTAVGPPGPPGVSGALSTANWRWSTGTGVPGHNHIGINATTWQGATRVNVDEHTDYDIDVAWPLSRIVVGDQIRLQYRVDATNWADYEVTGDPIDMGEWWSIPVAHMQSGGILPKNNNLTTMTHAAIATGQTIFATEEYVNARTPQITVAPTAPTSPAVGDIWVNTT